MRITSFPLGPIETNSYILDNGRDALSIDVGGDPAPILAFLQKEKLTLLAILVTHRHFDHLYGIHALQEALHVPAYVPTGDDCIAQTESSRGGIWGMPLVPDFEATPLPGKNLIIGSFACRVLLTPGHTPGGVSYYFEKAKAVFTGDALFYRSLGRTDFPGGNHAQLVRSIRENLFTLPADTTAYPGHGPETNIGEERLENPFIGDFPEM